MTSPNPQPTAAPATPSGDLLALTDEQLRAEIVRARAQCRPQQWKYAELVAQGGMTAAQAVRVAYGSRKRTNGSQPMRVEAVARAVALLREEYGRRAGTTARELRLFWVKLRDAAFSAGKYEAGNRANELLAKLAGLFPEQQLRVRVDRGVDINELSPEELDAAARFVHEVRPQLASARVVEADFAAIGLGTVPGDHEGTAPQAKPGDCQSQDQLKEFLS